MLNFLNWALKRIQLAFLYPLTKSIELVYVDVGASAFKLPSFSFCFGKVEVIGFEPDDRSSTDLTKGYQDDTKFFNVALSNVDGMEDLYLTEKSHCSSLMRPIQNGDARYALVGVDKIRCARLDSLDINADIVKIDVQGAEKKVLEGAIETLKDVSVLECELFLTAAYENQTTFEDLQNILVPLGFEALDFSSVYRKRSECGQIQFVDLVFVNRKLVLKRRASSFTLLAHAVERDYVHRLDLDFVKDQCGLVSRMLITLVGLLSIMTIDRNQKLKG